MLRTEYTTHDVAGRTVAKGDTVTIAFTGIVRSVTRDGHVVVKTADGTFASFNPLYQTLHKHEDDQNV